MRYGRSGLSVIMAENKKDQASSLREMVGRNQQNMVKLITVASGKGGVGKSSIAVNLAIALRRLGKRVLVVDADFGLANVDVMLGVNARYNMSHVLNGEKSLEEIIQEGTLGVRFISGGSGVFELLEMGDAQLRNMMRELRTLRNAADVILFDSGAGINDNVLQLIMASSEAIVVTTPEPTAILDAYALIKTVIKKSGTHSIRLIMNKCDNRKEAESATEGFQKVISKHMGITVESLGCVMYDNAVPKSIKQMTPVLVSNPDAQVSREIMSIASRLLDLPEPKEPTGLFAKLFSRWT